MLSVWFSVYVLLKQIKSKLLLKTYKPLCVSVVCYLHVVDILSVK